MIHGAVSFATLGISGILAKVTEEGTVVIIGLCTTVRAIGLVKWLEVVNVLESG